jgi:hypothetical protein
MLSYELCFKVIFRPEHNPTRCRVGFDTPKPNTQPYPTVPETSTLHQTKIGCKYKYLLLGWVGPGPDSRPKTRPGADNPCQNSTRRWVGLAWVKPSPLTSISGSLRSRKRLSSAEWSRIAPAKLIYYHAGPTPLALRKGRLMERENKWTEEEHRKQRGIE